MITVGKPLILLSQIGGFARSQIFMSLAKIEYRFVNDILYARTDIRLDKFVTAVGKHPV
jgi:hypothetical protein